MSFVNAWTHDSFICSFNTVDFVIHIFKSQKEYIRSCLRWFVIVYDFQTQMERILVFKGNCQVISMLYNDDFFILYTDSQIIWFLFNSYEIKYNKTDIRHPCVIPFVILNVLDNHSLPFMLNFGFLYDISTHLRNWSIILKVF